MYRPRENSSFSEATRAGVRMSFHKHWASYDLSFNIESHLRWPVIAVPDPSAAAHRPLLSFQDYGAGLGMEN